MTKRPRRMRPMIADDEYFDMSADDCVRSDPPRSAETKEASKIGLLLFKVDSSLSQLEENAASKSINPSTFSSGRPFSAAYNPPLPQRRS